MLRFPRRSLERGFPITHLMHSSIIHELERASCTCSAHNEESLNDMSSSQAIWRRFQDISSGQCPVDVSTPRLGELTRFDQQPDSIRVRVKLPASQHHPQLQPERSSRCPTFLSGPAHCDLCTGGNVTSVRREFDVLKRRRG